MHVRRVTIERFRGISSLTLAPGPRTVILGPQNAGKSTVLEALDLLLHSGLGRPRPAPTEIDYYGRDPAGGFYIEAVIGDLDEGLLAESHRFLEGWSAGTQELVDEPDGEGIEPVVRVCVRGTQELDVLHEFAKPDVEGARLSRAYRARIGWVFDGRQRDPTRQLSFYQGALFDQLFGGHDLEPAVEGLREALRLGGVAVNDDGAVATVLSGLARNLTNLGLLEHAERPAFEVGSVSRRELLQSLRLGLPTDGVQIPLARQGRGAQRLLLVSVLLGLAQLDSAVPIGGFEEPEEALEPLRQAQLASMLTAIADNGGQIFVVTHSPEIARAFEIDDFVLMKQRSRGGGACELRTSLSHEVRQTYERWLDGAVVRGLFSRVPVLVEGPSDRAVIGVFWEALAAPAMSGDDSVARPMAQLGVDIVNSEGSGNMANLAAVLHQAGKDVVAWVEQDTPEVRAVVDGIRDEAHCAAIVSHDPSAGRQNLEAALANGSSVATLVAALDAVASDRGCQWSTMRGALLNHLRSGDPVDPAQIDAARSAETVTGFLGCLDDSTARGVVARALAAGGDSPFGIKGGRAARLFAVAVVETEGVPVPFARAIAGINHWIVDGCPGGTEIGMADDGAEG